LAAHPSSIMVKTYSTTMVVNKLVAVALVVVALEVDTGAAAVVVGRLEAVQFVVHPFPLCFGGLALVAILGVVLEAELLRVHFQDFVIRPSNRPYLVKQVLHPLGHLVLLLLLLI